MSTYPKASLLRPKALEEFADKIAAALQMYRYLSKVYNLYNVGFDFGTRILLTMRNKLWQNVSIS